MKNTTKGFALILITILGLLIISVSVYYYYSTRLIADKPINLDDFFPSQNESVTFQTQDNTLTLLVDNKNVQTLSLPDQTLADFVTELRNEEIKKFITDLDVNFDGLMDVGVITGIGYGGVNNYYDFYIYNQTTKQLEKNSQLISISNPVIDKENKRVYSLFRSGPLWYQDTYVYKNGTYTYIKDQMSGSWVLEECSSGPSLNGVSTPCWTYTLMISDNTSSFGGTLSVDGQQTMTDINIKITQKTSIDYDVVFDSYGEKNISGNGFKKGDVLFTLKPTDDDTKFELVFVKMKPLSDKVLDTYYLVKTY